MRVKDIYIEIKKSKNYQTYTCGMTVQIHEGDDEQHILKETQCRCRKAVQEEINLDSKDA